jgi:UDP-N-acetylglucosamine:LPS N-acetylglucosamine transferase
MFNVDVNDLLIPSVAGKADADKIRMYGGGNVSAVDFPIRKEALSIYGKKSEIRAELGVGKDEFVVTMSDGGYGLANMEATINKLLKTNAKLTLFALCGTNESLFRRLSDIKETGSIKLIPISFTNDVLKYIAASDLFCGKSGANSMAEPAFFGVPIIVTRSITYIERKIKKYYVKELGGAISKPFPKIAAKKIAYFAENPEALDPYRKGLQKVCGKAGTDAVAELIFDRINNNVRN